MQVKQKQDVKRILRDMYGTVVNQRNDDKNVLYTILSVLEDKI